MPGGHRYRKFYISEAGRIDNQHRERLPETKFTEEEVRAGLDILAKTFGFYATLLHLEKETMTSREKLLKWSVYDFHYNIVYLAHSAERIKRYGEILRAK